MEKEEKQRSGLKKLIVPASLPIIKLINLY